MEGKEFNPLEGWSKEQVKSALKAHTKTELLKIAMEWRIIAEQLLAEKETKKENES